MSELAYIANEATYIIYKNGSTYYLKDGATGKVTSSNATLNTLVTATLTAMTSGILYLKECAFDLTLLSSIPRNVRVESYLNYEHYSFINSLDGVCTHLYSSKGVGQLTGYYITEDKNRAIILASTSASTLLQATVNILPTYGGKIELSADTFALDTELDFPTGKVIDVKGTCMDMLLASSGGTILTYSGTDYVIGNIDKGLSSWTQGIVRLDGIKIICLGHASGGIYSPYNQIIPYNCSIYGSAYTRTEEATGYYMGPISNGVEPNIDNLLISAFKYGCNFAADHISVNHLTITDCTEWYLRLSGTGITIQYMHNLGGASHPTYAIEMTGVAQGCTIGQWHLEEVLVNPIIHDATPAHAHDGRACLTIGSFTSYEGVMSYPKCTNGNLVTSKGDSNVVIYNWNGKIATKVPTWSGNSGAITYVSNIPVAEEGYYSVKVLVAANAGAYDFNVVLGYTDKFGTAQTTIVPMVKQNTGVTGPNIVNTDGHGSWVGIIPLFITDNSQTPIIISTVGTFTNANYSVTAIFEQYAV